MFQLDEAKHSVSTERRAKEIIIDGVIFMAAVISAPNQAVQFYNSEWPGAIIDKSLKSSSVDSDLMDTFASVLNKLDNKKLSEFLEELNEYQDYEYDWDGDGGLAIDMGTIKMAKRMVKETKEWINYLDEIYPTPLGTLCLQWKHGTATINAEVSKKGISFYTDRYSDGSEVSDYEKSIGITPEFLSEFKASFI